MLRIIIVIFILLISPGTLLAQASPKTLDELVDKLSRDSDANVPDNFSGPFHAVQKSEFDRWPKNVFVDPDLDFVRITKQPGQTWKDCERDSSQCLGWPDGQTRITRELNTPIQEREELDLKTGEVESVQYMKVKFEYERNYTKADGSSGVLKKSDEGWIDTRVLRQEKLESLYKEPTAPVHKEVVPKKAPPPSERPCQTKNIEAQNRKGLGDIGSLITRSEKEQLSATADMLKSVVGQCPLHPPDEKKVSQWKGKNIYDTEALPLLNSQRSKLPPIPKLSPDGKSMGEASFGDVVAIDTLARTLYSEMNECFQQGLQFPMAAAKVALNRAQMVDDGSAPKHFYGQPQVNSKPSISKVLTAPYQFSVWNQAGVANPRDKTVLMSLCPARDKSSKNWKGSKSTPSDQAAWDLSLKIATEAILFRSRFDAKTKQVSQLYYTSKMSSYDGRVKPSPAPAIEGRAVESFRCMYVWNGK